jgi:hypothetical protein
MRSPASDTPPQAKHPSAEAGALASGQLREQEARAALLPLAPTERPRPLIAAIVVAVILAIGVCAGVAVGDLHRHGGSVLGGLFLASVLTALAVGMYYRRYWAVLGFQALLAFQILATCLALVVSSTLLAAAVCAASVALGGWLFWRLIRVLGRIQVTERGDPQALR